MFIDRYYLEQQSVAALLQEQCFSLIKQQYLRDGEAGAAYLKDFERRYEEASLFFKQPMFQPVGYDVAVHEEGGQAAGLSFEEIQLGSPFYHDPLIDAFDLAAIYRINMIATESNELRAQILERAMKRAEECASMIKPLFEAFGLSSRIYIVTNELESHTEGIYVYLSQGFEQAQVIPDHVLENNSLLKPIVFLVKEVTGTEELTSSVREAIQPIIASQTSYDTIEPEIITRMVSATATELGYEMTGLTSFAFDDLIYTIQDKGLPQSTS